MAHRIVLVPELTSCVTNVSLEACQPEVGWAKCSRHTTVVPLWAQQGQQGHQGWATSSPRQLFATSSPLVNRSRMGSFSRISAFPRSSRGVDAEAPTELSGDCVPPWDVRDQLSSQLNICFPGQLAPGTLLKFDTHLNCILTYAVKGRHYCRFYGLIWNPECCVFPYPACHRLVFS